MAGRRAIVSVALAALLATLVAAAGSGAKPGRSDNKFGTQFHLGVVPSASWPDGVDHFGGMVMSPGGKMVLTGDTEVGGEDDFILARLGRNGKIDTSFGDPVAHVASGNIFGDDEVSDAAVAPSGKIVVVAHSLFGGVDAFGVARTDNKGILDPSFNGSGTEVTALGANSAPTGVAIQKNGKIVVVGNSGSGNDQFTVLRYLAGGGPDPSFGGGDGIVTTNFGSGDTDALDVAIQKDGKILVTGLIEVGSSRARGVLARYRSNGTLDPSFGKGGKVKFGNRPETEGFAVAIRRDGRIVVCGAGGSEGGLFAMVASFTRKGRLEKGFGPSGKGFSYADLDLPLNFALNLALQRNGKIVIAGIATDVPFAVGAFIARFTARGRIDRSFGIGGSHLFLIGSGQDFSVGGGGLGLQSDGRIVTGGTVSIGGTIAALVVKRFFGDPPRSGHAKAGRTR
jgi:uncharacterized delta-60 repeat protein